FRLVHAQTREAVVSVRKALAGEGPAGLGGEAVLLARDGRQVPVEDSAAPVRGAGGGEGRGAVGGFKDITERRRMEEELRRRAEELAEANRAKDVYLSMLAHELRNPLAPLLTSLHVLRQGALEAGAREESLARAERQAKHLRRLVDDLLEASSLVRGRVELRLER